MRFRNVYKPSDCDSETFTSLPTAFPTSQDSTYFRWRHRRPPTPDLGQLALISTAAKAMVTRRTILHGEGFLCVWYVAKPGGLG